MKLSRSVLLWTTAAIGTGLTTSCNDQQHPLGAFSRSPAFDIASTESESISEQLQVELSFEGPGKSRLAPNAIILGRTFALHLKQDFAPLARVLTLQLSIENLTPINVWRPLRAEAIALKPSGVLMLDADNGEEGTGAKWDYGQTTGLDGKLVPGEVSSSRTMRIKVQAQDEASLHDLRLTFRIEGTADPAFEPTPARDPTPAEAQAGFGAGILFVKYRAGVLSQTELASINLRFGLVGQDYDRSLGGYIAFLENTSFGATQALREVLAQDNAVQNVFLNIVGRFSKLALPSKSETGHHLILGNFPTAWEEDAARGATPGSGVVVGLLDTGIGVGLDDFKGQVLDAVDVRFGFHPDPEDHDGHGTAVASAIVAAVNGNQIVGGAYGAKIVSIKVANSSAGFFFLNLVSGLQYLVAHPEISVANLSLTSYDLTPTRQEALDAFWAAIGADALVALLDFSGTVVVAAAGNCDAQNVGWPANLSTRFSNVLAVGGTDNVSGTTRWFETTPDPKDCPTLFGATAAGSSYGPEVNIVAPAKNVDALALSGAIFPATGTSIAAPQVAAMAAILKARNPDLKGGALRGELERHTTDLGTPGRDEFFGFGRILAALPPSLPVTFNQTNIALAGGPLRATIGDLDGDGRPDLVVTQVNHGNGTTVAALRNTGGGGALSFVTSGLFGVGTGPQGDAIVDLDADGRLDVIAANATSGTVSALRNTSSFGSVSFAASLDVFVGLGLHTLAIGDLDGDGRPDVAVGSDGNVAVGVLRNTSTTGTLSFGSVTNLGMPSFPNTVAIGDLDGDGKPDVVATSINAGAVSVFRNTSTLGSLSFDPREDFSVGYGPAAVMIGDIDGDGRQDLVVCHGDGTTMSVLKNTGSPGAITMGNQQNFTILSGGHACGLADLDRDGRLDVVISNGTFQSMSFYRNMSTSGSVSFAPRVDASTGASLSSVTLGDVDGDGKADVVGTSEADNVVAVLTRIVFSTATP